MVKFDFCKIEQTLGQALHCTFVNKLVSGTPVSYNRAVSFFGVEVQKPNPTDSVIEALAEWQKESLEEIEGAPKKEEETPIETPKELGEEILFVDPSSSKVPPLYVLRKRLLWFVRQRVADIYTLLNTTKEEIIALRKKDTLTPEDKARVDELLKKSSEINDRLLKRLGVDTDEGLIEKEKKRHIRKRFNVKESWLPL